MGGKDHIPGQIRTPQGRYGDLERYKIPKLPGNAFLTGIDKGIFCDASS